jgi:hypothetical protein
VGAFSGRIYRYQGSGRYAQPGGVRLTDYLLLTRCHVVFWGRGVYGQTIEAIRYQDISDVAYTSGMIFGEIVLGTRAGQKKFGDMYHSDVPVAADMIRETMRSCQKPDQTKVRYEEEQSIGKPLPGASLVSVVDAFVYPGVQGTS